MCKRFQSAEELVVWFVVRGVREIVCQKANPGVKHADGVRLGS